MKRIIVGIGNMGRAIADGLKNEPTTFVVKSAEQQEFLQARFPLADIIIYEDGIDITEAVLIIAVKPQRFDTLRFSGTADAVISVMAGVTLQQISRQIAANAYIRAMPNLAASCGFSTTALTGSEGYRQEAESLLESIGETFWLPSEKELDIATALAGSGPAFLAVIAESMVDAAVREGMPRATAAGMVHSLFRGTTELLANESPVTIKERVMSPGGTTAEGLFALESGGVRKTLFDAIAAAHRKAAALGAPKKEDTY